MVKFILIIGLLFHYLFIDAQESDKKSTDSLMHNRYNKGTIYFGGSPGGGILEVKNEGIIGYNLNNSFEFGYFISNRTLLLMHSYYSYRKSISKDHQGIDVWSYSSRQSIILRRYFHPKKISFFGEFGVDYDNFYTHMTYYNYLPAEWFNIGSISGGIGANIFVYKFDIMIGYKYRIPLLYDERAKEYSTYGFIPGLDFIFGTYFTF
jgi:hypothetical protein